MRIFKNGEIKRLTTILIIGLIFIMLLSIIVTNIIIKNYKVYFINYNAKVISAVLSKYPEAQTDVVNVILESKSGDGLEELKKYGINDASVMSLVNSVQREYNNVLKATTILSLTIYLLLIVVVFFFLSKIYKRIRGLNDYTLDIAYKNYGIDIIDNSEGDISILKNHLFDITRILKENNELLEHDKAYLKDAIADISHQLKTPLTSLYLFNEILSDEKDASRRSEFLSKMRDELERIEWLISSLLKMSKLDSKTIVLRNEKIEVKTLIENAIMALDSLIDAKKIKISINGDNRISLMGDFNWLKEALINIVKNGIEHSDENGTINIDYNVNPLYTEITIMDNGEGIAASDMPYIFDRFYKARGSSKNSIGIGLALAKSIINSQNGDLSVKSKLGSYTKFTIKIYSKRI